MTQKLHYLRAKVLKIDSGLIQLRLDSPFTSWDVRRPLYAGCNIVVSVERKRPREDIFTRVCPEHLIAILEKLLYLGVASHLRLRNSAAITGFLQRQWLHMYSCRDRLANDTLHAICTYDTISCNLSSILQYCHAVIDIDSDCLGIKQYLSTICLGRSPKTVLIVSAVDIPCLCTVLRFRKVVLIVRVVTKFLVGGAVSELDETVFRDDFVKFLLQTPSLENSDTVW